MAVIFLGLMSVIILRAVPLHFAGRGGCKQVNPSLNEESPALPDKIKDAGPIEQIYCIKTEDTGCIEQIYYIKTEEQRYSIKTEEQIYSIKIEDVEPIEQIYSIKTEEAISAEQDHHFVQTDDASSAEEDVAVGKKTLETNFKMSEEVCILFIYSLFLYCI